MSVSSLCTRCLTLPPLPGPVPVGRRAPWAGPPGCLGLQPRQHAHALEVVEGHEPVRPLDANRNTRRGDKRGGGSEATDRILGIKEAGHQQ